MNTHKNFLEFNGKTIFFINADGNYWIALKPICEALNIDVRRSREVAKKDPILGAVVSEQTLQVEKNGIIQGRKMTCLPEKYIYGWLFSLRSDSEELIDYKKTCYDLLFEHFHGTITNRKDLLLERQAKDFEIQNLKKELSESDSGFKKLRMLEQERKQLSTQLNAIDNSVINQTEMDL